MFSAAEVAYLSESDHLGRLATVDPDGLPHVVPTGWAYNSEEGTIDIGGRDPAEFIRTRKFRNVQTNPKVAFVIDDVLPPWRPRAVMVRGNAEAVHDEPGDGGPVNALIRVRHVEVISWGV